MEKRYFCCFCPERGEPGSKYTLSVNWGKGVYFCHRCGAKGSTRDLAGRDLPGGAFDAQYGSILSPEDVLNRPVFSLPGDFKPIERSHPAWMYLQRRGLDPIPLAPYIGTSKNYLIFPIWKDGELVYYVGRKMYGNGRRYNNASGEGHHIFIPYEMPRVEDSLVITEGIFDCLKVYQSTKVPTVALLGITPATYKFSKVIDLTQRKTHIYLMLDGGTYSTAMEYLKVLEPLRPTSIINITAKDPAVMPRKNLRQLVYSTLGGT